MQVRKVLRAEALRAARAPARAHRRARAWRSCWPSAPGSSGRPLRRRGSSSVTSDAWPSVDCGRPVSEINRAPIRRIASSSRTSSSVSPLYDSATTTSSVLDHAEVAVQRFGGMQKDRGRARARKCRGELAGDDPGLAHAGDDDPARAAVRADRQRVSNCRPELRNQRRESPAPRSRAPGARDRSASSWGRRRIASTGSPRDRGARLDERVDCRSAARAAARGASSASAFCASLFAFAGSSCTSRKTPSTPARDARARQRFDVLGEARGHAFAAAGQLQTVRDVEHDRRAEAAHHREGAHVHDQVVVAEREPALGHEDAVVARTPRTLSTACRMSSGARNWPFLRLTTRPVRAAATIEIGLPREKRRNLQDVGDFGGRARLPGLVNVRQDGHADFVAEPGRAPRGPSSMPGPAERGQRRAVGLVE